MKIVVFDLDETLGYFTQFGIFWDILIKYLNNKPNKSVFGSVLDLYPEFLRPNIFSILTYLKGKMGNHCDKVFVYTNNMGPREWAEQIIHYFEDKIHYKLFHQIIAAFKINGKRVELGRTTQNKTHNDLIQCTKIPHETEICFIDDVFYPGMANDNVYYINIKPYLHMLSFQEMVDRFIQSPIGVQLCSLETASVAEFRSTMLEQIQMYHFIVVPKHKEEYEIDKILGKHIIYHLQKFFNQSSKNRTIKNRMYRRNKTLKNLEKS